MNKALHLIPLLLALGACGSAPKLPTVDESRKHPVNSAMAVELQQCKGDLQGPRLAANESGRQAQSAAAAIERLSERLSTNQPAPDATLSASNTVFAIRFAFASTLPIIPVGTGKSLIEASKDAPLMILRGRTDGTPDTPAAGRIAQKRAIAMRNFLIHGGISPERIRVTYQATGDRVADNSTPNGRALNRRVEVEIYRALPTMGDAKACARL